jgi:hypothetical protein
MGPLKVFISSVMRRSLEDLSAERGAARAAIERLRPIARAWAFENEPASTKRLRDSYIDEVKTCDLLVAIVGCAMTSAVRDEINIARDHNKGILAFAKDVEKREPEAAEVLRLLDRKYESFRNAGDLGPKAQRAVELEILRRAKPGTSGAAAGDRIAQLREMRRAGTVIRIAPMIPPLKPDLFRIADVDPALLVLRKNGTGLHVRVPTPRITEVLNMGPDEAPLVRIAGRLQWMTMFSEWRFLPEDPSPNDPFHLGVPREVGRQQIVALTQQGYPVGWSRLDFLAERLAAGTHQVFYDEGGYYLLSAGAVAVLRVAATQT